MRHPGFHENHFDFECKCSLGAFNAGQSNFCGSRSGLLLFEKTIYIGEQDLGMGMKFNIILIIKI